MLQELIVGGRADTRKSLCVVDPDLPPKLRGVVTASDPNAERGEDNGEEGRRQHVGGGEREGEQSVV